MRGILRVPMIPRVGFALLLIAKRDLFYSLTVVHPGNCIIIFASEQGLSQYYSDKVLASGIQWRFCGQRMHSTFIARFGDTLDNTRSH